MLRRSRASVWLGLCLVAAMPALAQPDEPTAGPAHSFQGLRLDGSEFDATELQGSFVLLDFWGVWCPPCIDAFPKLSRLHDDYSERGFQVVGLAVLSGTPEEVAVFLEDHDVTYPVVVVELDVPELFDVLAYPTYILVGPEGEILETYRGQPTDLYEIVAEDLEAALGAAGRLDTPTPPG